MLNEILELDVVSYSASISASEKGSQWAHALALLREMSDGRLESDVVSYNASISASEKGLQWEKCFKMLEDLPERMLESGVVHRHHPCGRC